MEIKAIHNYQLVNLRMFNTDPRALSHGMAGLRSTYSFETEGNSTKMDDIWETVSMDVNAMPGFVLDESENKEKDQSLFSVITVEKQDIFDGSAEERSRIMEE